MRVVTPNPFAFWTGSFESAVAYWADFVAFARGLSHFSRTHFSDVAVDQFVKSGGEASFQQSYCFAGESRAADECFKATTLSTPAQWTIRHNSLMTEFPGRSQGAKYQFAVDCDSAADPCTESQHSH